MTFIYLAPGNTIVFLDLLSFERNETVYLDPISN